MRQKHKNKRNITMNKLHLTFATSIVGSLLVASTVSADFQGIEIDTVDSGMGLGSTYRVYVKVDEGDQVNAVWGDGDNELLVYSSGPDGGFYQNQFGSHRPPSASLFGFFPSLQYDSFATIGLLNDTGDAMMEIGIDWTVFEGDVMSGSHSNGGDIWTDNGTWFATPDDPQVFEVGGRVLIGQFTTVAELDFDGIAGPGEGFNGIVNILGKNADLTSWEYSGVEFVPAPGALALLGLAGASVRRRRK
jgi:uncharacterized protein (TIGR03382 family)